ncbi:MAG: Npun_F0296 family exosortase-dependent surface protein, partial [Janthinobacterium lividum]
GTGGAITGKYSGSSIAAANLYGGAGGSGSYIQALANTVGYTITLATSRVPGVNYFGYWLSALDAGNQLTFKRDGAVVGSYSSADLVAALGACSASNPFCGNPTTRFKGQDSGEAFAFVNFVDLNGFFDEIDVYEKPATGNYESDNHTVAYCPTPSACVNGTAIPEPTPILVIAAATIGLALFRLRHRLRG